MNNAMRNEEIIASSKKLGWIVGILVLAMVILAAVGRKESSPSSGVEVKVRPLESGSALLNDKDVLELINRVYGHHLEGRPIGQIDPQRIEKMLEADPFVLNADVYFDAGNKVNVRIDQREPVLRIIDNNGLNYYLDKDGIKMPLSRRYAAHVLVATGNIPPHDPNFLERKRHLLKDVFLLAQTLREDPFFQVMIEQIYVSNTGEFTLVPKLGDQKILFGKFEDAGKKLEKLKIFYREGMPYEGWRKYKTIDVRFAGQVVCKKR